MAPYVVYSNVPGYLSEDDDPATFDDITAARSYLADMIERDWDSEYETAETDAERADIDARYLDAHTGANLISAGEGVYVPGPSDSHRLGMVYTLAVAED